MFKKLQGWLALAVLATGVAAPVVEAANRVVTVVNRTDTVMVEFYASNTGAKSWEEDILGKDVLDVGERVDIDIDDGTGACHFDFKGVFADGDEVVKTDVNVCRIDTFEFTP